MPPTKPRLFEKLRNFEKEAGLRSRMNATLLLPVALLVTTAGAQHDRHQPQTPSPVASQELSQATEVMARKSPEDHKHEAGPHMKLTTLRPPSAADDKRAEEIVKATRDAVEKYQDPAVAEADGFKLFMPQMKKQKQYHYTNYRYAFQTAFRFDPTRPTSLLYADDEKGKKRLIGVMFTAPAHFTEEQLNQRVPLSVSQWHQHVNLCVPPKGREQEMFGPAPKFGLMGSIATEAECTAAGGTFKPRIFGWMAHMYPWEKTQDEVWSVSRQLPEKQAHKH